MATLTLAVIFAITLNGVSGHGRLIDPPSRNAMWRFGFKNPANYNDNELNCGGFSVQWEKNKGRCGVCGDPVGVKRHIAPGKYANGIIGEVYRQGEDIEVAVDLTSNHQGWFEFRIAKLEEQIRGDEKGRLRGHLMRLVDGGTRFNLPRGSRNQVFKVRLQLPSSLSCDKCVMQWWYSAGNNWDCDKTGCGMGKGKQEHFVNCADVRIIARGEGATKLKPRVTRRPPVVVTDAPIPTTVPTGERGGCRATGSWEGNENMDRWCRHNCARGFCPEANCVCNM